MTVDYLRVGGMSEEERAETRREGSECGKKRRLTKDPRRPLDDRDNCAEDGCWGEHKCAPCRSGSNTRWLLVSNKGCQNIFTDE